MHQRSYTILSVLFLLVATNWSCKSQKQALESEPTISARTVELAERIKRDNVISSELIGRDSQSSPAYTNAQQLKDSASVVELRLLTDDDNPNLSAVAFGGLFEKDYDQIDEVLVKYIERDDQVKVIKGDVFLEMPLLEYAFENVMGYELKNPNKKPDISKQIAPELERMIRSKLYSGPPKE